MPLVKAQCNNCNGILEVDNSKDAAICPYCGTPYIVEKAINNFNISNTNYIQNAVFESGESEEKLLERGIKQLELKEYKDARETFSKMTKLFPGNYKGWLGMCIVEANEHDPEVNPEKCRMNVITQCPEEMREKLRDVRIRSNYNIMTARNKLTGAQSGLERFHSTYADDEKKLNSLKKVQLICRIMIFLLIIICCVAVYGFVRSDNLLYALCSIGIGTVLLVLLGKAMIAIRAKISASRFGVEKYGRLQEGQEELVKKYEDVIRNEETVCEEGYYIELMK